MLTRTRVFRACQGEGPGLQGLKSPLTHLSAHTYTEHSNSSQSLPLQNVLFYLFNPYSYLINRSSVSTLILRRNWGRTEMNTHTEATPSHYSPAQPCPLSKLNNLTMRIKYLLQLRSDAHKSIPLCQCWISISHLFSGWPFPFTTLVQLFHTQITKMKSASTQ